MPIPEGHLRIWAFNVDRWEVVTISHGITPVIRGWQLPSNAAHWPAAEAFELCLKWNAIASKRDDPDKYILMEGDDVPS